MIFEFSDHDDDDPYEMIKPDKEEEDVKNPIKL